MNLEQMTDFAAKTALGIIADGEEAQPMFIAQWGNGQIGIYATPWRNDDDKEFAARALKMLFAAREVQRYVFVSEGWAVMRKHESQIEGLRPSQEPDRVEILHVVGIERGAVRLGMGEIKHAEDGERSVPNIDWKTPDHVEGRFMELLPDPDAPKPPAGTAEKIEKAIGILHKGNLAPAKPTLN